MIRIGWPEIMAAAEAALASDVDRQPTDAERRILRAMARGIATVLGSELHAPGEPPEAAFEEVALVNDDGATVTLEPSHAMSDDLTLTLPPDDGSPGDVLATDGAGALSWVAPSGGIAVAAGTQTATSGTALFSNSNGISFGMSGSSRVTASYTTPVVSNAIQAVGSATAAGTNTSRFAADDHAHAGVAAVGVSTMGNSLGDTGSRQGTVLFAGLGVVTVSQSTAAGGQATINISAPAAAGDGFNRIAAGTQTAASATTVVFANSNGLSFGMSDSSQVTASYTSPVVSNALQSVGSVTGSGTNTSRFAADDHVHAGVGAFGVSNTGTTAGNTGTSVGTWVLAASGNVTASMSTGAAGVHTAWISVPTGGGGGIAASAGTQSVSTGTVLFADSNGISFGMSGSSRVTASYTTPVVSNAIQAVGSATGSGTNTSRFAADDHVHAGVGALGVSTGGNTLGNTATTQGTVVLRGAGAVTLSQATAGGGQATVEISAPAAVTLSEWGPFDRLVHAAPVAFGRNSIYFFPFDIPLHLSAYRMNAFISVLASASGVNSTGSIGHTLSFALYRRDTGTNFTRLTSLWSGSAFIRASYSSNTNISISHPIGISNSTAVSTTNYQSNATNATTYLASSVNGFRIVPFPISSTLEPGRYWVAFAHSSTSQNTHTCNVSMGNYTFSNQTGYYPFGTSSNQSRNNYPLAGTYSVTSGAFPGTVGASEIMAVGAMSAPLVNFSAYTTSSPYPL